MVKPAQFLAAIGLTLAAAAPGWADDNPDRLTVKGPDGQTRATGTVRQDDQGNTEVRLGPARQNKGAMDTTVGRIKGGEYRRYDDSSPPK